MENTYFQNNIVLIDKVFYKRQQPKRNDIIIVDYDDGLEDTLIIKRVIAVGGDHLDIVNNEVYINGKKLKENYIKEKMRYGRSFNRYSKRKSVRDGGQS